METKKTRKMSHKGFLHKMDGKAAVNASAFIAKHREWLASNVGEGVAPILRQVDAKEVMPTAAMPMIKEAVFAHMMLLEKQAVEARREKAEAKAAPSKPYTAVILDGKGNVVTVFDENGKEKELRANFDMGHQAQGWIDRRLFDASPDCHGVIQSNLGLPDSIVLREDSIARILKKPRQPVCQKKATSTPRLGFGVKAKQSHASFSHG